MTGRFAGEARAYLRGCLATGVCSALFLAGSLAADAPAAETSAPDPDTPVVLIVFDELPTANLMTSDGKRIDARRFPNFARFADGATWYRDNVAAGDFTAWAVPGILTGNTVDERTLPTTAAQPHNLFTRLGPGRRVHSLETVTELCPKAICPDGSQGGAPGVTKADDFIKAKYKPFRPARLDKWIRRLPAGERTISFAHVEVPHQPLRFLPSGQTYEPGPLALPTNLKVNGWTLAEPGVAFLQGRHLIQTGYADRLLGRILARIRTNGDLRDAMIVVTADHGIAFDPKDLRRDATRTNVGATLNPPLIIKYPGQRKGVVSTASTQSLDIYPTIAAQLGASIPGTDGKPVGLAGPDRVMTVAKDEMRRLKVTAAMIRADRRQVLASQVRRHGTGGLWHLGPQAGLIGRKPGSARVSRGSYRLYLPKRRIQSASRFRSRVPALISGRLTGVAAGRTIALAWNGRVVASTRTFRHRGKVHFGAMVPPAVMKSGRNRIAVYLTAGKAFRRIPPA